MSLSPIKTEPMVASIFSSTVLLILESWCLSSFRNVNKFTSYPPNITLNPVHFCLAWQRLAMDTLWVPSALYSAVRRAVSPASTTNCAFGGGNRLWLISVSANSRRRSEWVSGWVGGRMELSKFTCQTDRRVFEFQWQLLNMPFRSFRTLHGQLSWGPDSSVC